MNTIVKQDTIETNFTSNEPPNLVTQSGIRRLDYIDGLRAIAALSVVIGHIWMFQQPAFSQNSLFMQAMKILQPCGNIAVMVFLVLSGFCLYYPLLNKQPSMPSMALSYIDYMKRRARRILPPYYAALGITLFLALLFPEMRKIPINVPDGFGWGYALPINVNAIISHILLMHNVLGYSDRIDPPMWSIGDSVKLFL